MMPASDRDEPTIYGGEPPLEARIDRGTLIGCLGIVCVLILPVTFFLPLESWSLPAWALALVPLIAIGMAAFGAWLLVRVPSRITTRSSDPLHPLTSAGMAPVAERPAQRANHIGLLACWLLILLGAAAFSIVATGSSKGAIIGGAMLASVAGALLLLYGLLSMRGRLPVPALRWVRQPIQSGLIFQAMPLLLIGMVLLTWAMVIAIGQGYLWSPLAVGAVVLGCALAGPVAQRFPTTRRSSRRTAHFDR